MAFYTFLTRSSVALRSPDPLVASASMPQPPRLVLASASPRRRALLRQCGLRFTVRTSDLAETGRTRETPRARAGRLARDKAREVAGRLRSPAWVLGCDTLVAIGSRILEKPRTTSEAARMLERLSGRWHEVISSVALVPACLAGFRPRQGSRRTRVRFTRLTPLQVSWILQAGEHLDKAGAYALQGRAGAFIRAIEGSCSNVIGLPLDLVSDLLGELGYMPAPRTADGKRVTRHPSRGKPGSRKRS